ncbi:MAG: histidine kinase [Lachnospiraceae bacterium]|nr:histidine kinase [Lachnospiraceae bacterium]
MKIKVREWRWLVKLRNMKLFQKMLFFYVVLLCVPIALIGAFYIGIFSHQLNEQYRKNKEDILEQGIYSIENTLTQINFCVSSFQYNTGVLQYVDRYDFSTGEGASCWLGSVKPAFQQLKHSNPYFSNICIWRTDPKSLNDPRYVLNAQDSEELKNIEPLRYNDLKVFFHNEDDRTECSLYGPLFDFTALRKIGYVEVACRFDYLFFPLNFVNSQEKMIITQDENSYQVSFGKDGSLFLKKSDQEKHYTGHKITNKIEALNLSIDYYYQDFKVLSNSTFITVLVCVFLLFLLFSMVYYAFYVSITRRITNLTDHMFHNTQERLQPYRDDPNQDEIGTMIQVYNQMTRKMNLLIEELIQKERLANQAQYYAMQSQIQPHFLYNTLENIDMLIEVGENEKASRMMNVFGKILRYNLSRRRKLSTIGEEISHISDYLALYSFRMRDDFQYEIHMEPECEKIVCPYCILQPVVENCFKHGFRILERALWVHVRGFVRDGFVILEVEDNGVGITGERLAEVKSELKSESSSWESKDDASIGLDNVKKRILLLGGAGSGLWIYPRPQGCMVSMQIRIEGETRDGSEGTDC